MKLDLLVFAEYAAVTQENKLVIAGTFNTIGISRVAESQEGRNPTLILPRVYLVAAISASLSEGLRHTAEIRVIDSDHKPVWEPISLGEWNFAINPNGRPMRFQAVIAIPGVPLPGAGEFTFELRISNTPVGSVELYVDEVSHP